MAITCNQLANQMAVAATATVRGVVVRAAVSRAVATARVVATARAVGATRAARARAGAAAVRGWREVIRGVVDVISGDQR